jgi:hypothetical protein
MVSSSISHGEWKDLIVSEAKSIVGVGATSSHLSVCLINIALINLHSISTFCFVNVC